MIKQITPNMVINSFIEHYLKFLTETDMFRHRRFAAIELPIEVVVSGLFKGFHQEAPVVVGINSGDCGVAAIAIGWVLSHFRPDSEIVYYDNGEHAYFSMDGMFYDTICRHGKRSHVEMFGGKPEKEIKPLTLDGLCNAFIIADVQGQQMISSFCELWGVPGICFEEYNKDLSLEDIAAEVIFTQHRRDTAIKEL